MEKSRNQKDIFSEIFTERCTMKGRSNILRKQIDKYTYQSIPQYQSEGAGTWSQDRPHSCAELFEKYILQSTYSTAVYRKKKTKQGYERETAIYCSEIFRIKESSLLWQQRDQRLKAFWKRSFHKINRSIATMLSNALLYITYPTYFT